MKSPKSPVLERTAEGTSRQEPLEEALFAHEKEMSLAWLP